MDYFLCATLLLMKKTFLLTAFFSILLLLPLGHDLGRYGFFGGALWNDNGFLLLLFFLASFIYFGVQKKYSLNSFGVLLLASLAALIFVNVSGHGIFFSHFSAWTRYLVFILLPLFFFQTIGSAHRFYISFLFIGLVVLQAQWGLLQFILQHDLGFTFLGEPHLTAGTNGVAKFMMQGTKIIRAYGPYLHPNALAASLVAGLQMCAFFMINLGRQKKSARYGVSIYIMFTSFFILLALLVTFSRAGLLGFGFVLCTYVFLKLRPSFRLGG